MGCFPTTLRSPSAASYDRLFGDGDNGGEEDFEYGLDFACTLERTDLASPAVQRISPMLEVDGEPGLNGDEGGQNSVPGGAGFRLDFRPVGDLEPNLGLSYVFPMSGAVRDEVHGASPQVLRWSFDHTPERERKRTSFWLAESQLGAQRRATIRQLG